MELSPFQLEMYFITYCWSTIPPDHSTAHTPRVCDIKYSEDFDRVESNTTTKGCIAGSMNITNTETIFNCHNQIYFSLTGTVFSDYDCMVMS